MDIKEAFVDIHSHILPGVDDGASNTAESIEMLKIAYEQGIRTIVATPHYGRFSENFDADTIKKVVAFLQNTAEKMQLNINILAGNEIYYSSDIIEDLNEGKALCLGDDKCVLIEFSISTDYATIIAACRELKLAGYQPIIAHAERYIALHNIDNVKKLKEEGVMIQVNADMLTEPPAKEERETLFGKRRHIDMVSAFKKAAWKLLQSELVDFIATDAHNSTYRKPVMRDALQVIEKTLGTIPIKKYF